MDYGYGMNGNQFYGQMPGNAGQVYQRPAMQPQQMFGQQMQSNAPQRSGYSTMMGYNGKGQSGGSKMSGRSGYNDQTIENIRQIMETSDPMRKEQLKQDLMRMMQEVGI